MIYLVSFSSYTSEDNYLYNSVQAFSNKEEAEKKFALECELAFKECQWGAQYDGTDEERDQELKYDVDVLDTNDDYTVSSMAYGGYICKVSLITTT